MEETELDRLAVLLQCRPDQVVPVIEMYLKYHPCTGGGCSGNGLDCMVMNLPGEV